MSKRKSSEIMQSLKKTHIYQLQHCNQFLLESKDYRVFQSYNSIIAIYEKDNRQLTLGRDWDYSNTTLKHLYLFINDYCYLPEIDSILYNATNKKQAIIKLIKQGVINYDNEMK